MNPMMLGLLLAAADPAAWTELVKQDGVVVETRADGEQTWVRGRGVIAVPFEKLEAAFLSLKRFPTWMPSLTEWNILSHDDKEAFVYGRHKLPWPMDDRDYVVRYTWKREPGKLVLESRSVSGRAAKKGGVIRLEAVHSIFALVETKDGRTAVTYQYNGDLGGSVPRWAMESGWKSEAPSLFRAIGADF